MGRKSLAETRTNQILDAFEQCIVAHGLEGATLQRTADVAQVNLGMIHHYIGRKDDLLSTMLKRLTLRVEHEMGEFDQFVPNRQRLPLLLTSCFEDEADNNDRLVDALYSSGLDNPAVEATLEKINQLYVSIWAAEIGRIHPQLSQQRCSEIALSVLGLAYSSELLSIDGLRPEMWRISAETLINNP